MRRGYQVAVRTGPWTIERDERTPTFMFTAAIAEVDDVWLAQRPLDLVLALGQVEWVWHDVTPTIVDARMTLQLTRRPDVAGPRVA